MEDQMNNSLTSAEENSSDDACTWIEHFESFCESDSLTMSEVRRMTEGIGPEDLRGSSFLHRVCLNWMVTKEIVEYLLNLFPEAVEICCDVPEVDAELAYPLHLACYNEHCPNSVIEFILNFIGSEHCSLNHLCFVDGYWENDDYYSGTNGLPLHYYLARKFNVDIHTVKMMVKSFPESLSSWSAASLAIHVALRNENLHNMTHVVIFLAESNSSSVGMANERRDTALHIACSNKKITLDVVRTLLEAFPHSTSKMNDVQEYPLHCFCSLGEVSNDKEAEGVLALLLEAFPGAAKHPGMENSLPLHEASRHRGPGFCKMLVAAYPEAVRKMDWYCLPFHNACQGERPDTVKYLFDLYPEAMGEDIGGGCLPIHYAASGSGKNFAEIIDFLVENDPECISRTASYGDASEGSFPLHIACANCPADGMAEYLFDLYPEAILEVNSAGRTPIDELVKWDASLPINDQTGLPWNQNLRQRTLDLISYLSSQARYAHTAHDERAMSTRNCRGCLPLHTALEDHASLGAIKLLVKGNPNAFGVANNEGELPLDLACRSGSVGIVKFFAEYFEGCMDTFDSKGNFPLHHACRGGNFDVVKYLLERPMSSVSERNADGKLPIHLYCGSIREQCTLVQGGELECQYIETLWRLLLAYPETVVNW